jgi:hypothetical protein
MKAKVTPKTTALPSGKNVIIRVSIVEDGAPVCESPTGVGGHQAYEKLHVRSRSQAVAKYVNFQPTNVRPAHSR